MGEVNSGGGRTCTIRPSLFVIDCVPLSSRLVLVFSLSVFLFVFFLRLLSLALPLSPRLFDALSEGRVPVSVGGAQVRAVLRLGGKTGMDRDGGMEDGKELGLVWVGD